MSKFTKKATIKGLVIQRKEGEQIVINQGELRIEVVEVKSRWVRLAFQASSEISIQRAEAVLEKKSESICGS